MASKKRAASVGAGAFAAGKAARDNEYVQRLVEDEELRDSLREAFAAARGAYDRVSHNRHPARALFDDKRVQRDLQNAATSLREASDSLRGRDRRSGSWFKRVVVVGVVGAGIALVASEGLRKKALDALFGAEEEFEYTSTTSPPPAGASNGSSAPAPAEEKTEETAEKS